MPSFADFATAAAFRDLVQSVVGKELERERPGYSYAVVVSIDHTLRTCTVLFPGETNTVTVKLGAVHPQAAGQVVRIDGRRGDRYVADVMGSAWLEAPVLANLTALSVASLASTGDVVAGTTSLLNAPRGFVAMDSRTTTTPGITTETLVLVVEVDMPTTRRFKASVQLQDVNQTTASDIFVVAIKEGVSGTYLAQALSQDILRWPASPFWVGPGLGGVRSIQATLRRSSGVSSAVVTATVNGPAVLLIEDIGPA